MRRKKPFEQRVTDVERVRAYRAGRLVRTQGRPISDCPHFHNYFGAFMADRFEQAWKEGWEDRDLEIRSPQLPLTGVET